MYKQAIISVLFGALTLTFFSCTNEPKEENRKPLLVCTTNVVADAVKQIAGDKFEVQSLMAAGVDPHVYKPTQGDLTKLRQADVIFYNGLHLEGKMTEILEQMSTQTKVVRLSDGIDESDLIKDNNKSVDPHVWFNVEIWNSATQHAAKSLGEYYPKCKTTIDSTMDTYTEELERLHFWVESQMTAIPDSQRVLVTTHDAFSYFCEAYTCRVKTLQGISTMSEFGLKDVTMLTDFIAKNKIKAVFIESSISDKAIKAVIEGSKSKGHNVIVGGTLYTDALGDENTPEGNYVGMIKHNVNTIIEALK